MKKTFFMTLIALSISGMSCAQSDTENTAKKQETVQQEFVKERREQAKMAKSLIEQKVLKDAKKQAKQLKKEGWQPAPGTLPLEKQLTDVYTRACQNSLILKKSQSPDFHKPELCYV